MDGKDYNDAMTLFLDVPPETSAKLIENRPRKDSDAPGKDILESEKTFLSDSYWAAQKTIKDWGWVRSPQLSPQVLQSWVHSDIAFSPFLRALRWQDGDLHTKNVPASFCPANLRAPAVNTGS